MLGWVFLCLFFFCVGPAWADVALAPVSLYLSGWVLLWPMLIGVILLEAALLWQFWGKRAGYGPLKVLSQVTWVNILSTLAGGVFLLLGDLLALYDPLLPLLIYFLLTLWIETALFKRAYAPENTGQKIGPKEVWKASLTLNLSSYLLILLALVVIPNNHSQSERRSRTVSIRANMHTLQTLVETYGVDWGGEYPKDIKALETAAKSMPNPYWKDLIDPDQKSPLLYSGEEPRPFSIEYLPIVHAKTQKILSYWIYGYDKKGKRLMQNGQHFALTNS